MSPTSVIYYQPVVSLDMSDTLRFSIDPGDDDIWNHEDEDTLNTSVVFTETAGIDAYITAVEWRIKDYDGNTRETGVKIFTAPQLINGDKSDTFNILFVLNGGNASQIDEFDGAQDDVAFGIIEVDAKMYDNNGVTYTTRTLYKNITAVQP